MTKGFPYFVSPDINGKEQDPVAYLYQRLLEQQHQIDALSLELRFLKQKVTPAFENTRKAEVVGDNGQIQLGSAPKPAVVPIMDGVTGETVATFEVQRRDDFAEAPMVIAKAPVIEVVQDKPVETELIINDEWRSALDVMDNGTDHIFITGKAGAGKTTLLTKWIGESSRNAPVVASTGIAALRAGGQTIHSFFRFEARAMDSDYIPDLREKDILKLQNLDDLIIDEVSMVRPDLMDAIQRTLSKYGPKPGKPFGGVRLIMVGDLYQLPPVVADTDKKNKPVQTFMVDHYGTKTPYFFHADCWREKPPEIHELTRVFRQSDMAFVDALNAVREGTLTETHLDMLNTRTVRDFIPPANETWMRLVTTNAKVQEANELMLQQLPGKGRIFEALIQGDFGKDDSGREDSGEKYPTERTLELKPGALVMFVKNDKNKHWVNGTTGRVLEVSPILTIEVNGIGRVVMTEEWESVTYEYDRKAHKIKKIVKGAFRQIPVKVAAAATIHKTQGMTLDRAILDLSWGTFADGQLYVGLSRLKSLEGLVLARSIKMDDLKVNKEVLAFMKGGEIARPVTQLF